jgi:hypothetical protein
MGLLDAVVLAAMRADVEVISVAHLRMEKVEVTVRMDDKFTTQWARIRGRLRAEYGEAA